MKLNPYGPRPDPTPSEGPDPYGNPDPEWLGIDWREHLRTIEVSSGEDRARVGYVDRGPTDGDPERLAIVLVHGLSGCWQNWLENIPALARRRRVVALDLPGFGSSPVPDWEITITAYGRLVRAFCDQIGVDDCAIVGNSMGGFVAAEAVSHDPERFERFILVSAAGVSSVRLKRQPTEVGARMMAAAAPYTFKLTTRSFARPRARAIAFRGIFRHPELLRPELLWEFFSGSMNGDGFTDALGALAGYDFRDHLAEVEVPALIVWGRNDNVVPPADAAEYARMLRNSQTTIFGDTGHVPMAERPVRFNRLLEAFVSR